MIKKWISVKERFPNMEEVVLVFCPDWCEEEYDLASVDWKNEWTNGAGQDMEGYVTHWMELPKKPQNNADKP